MSDATTTAAHPRKSGLVREFVKTIVYAGLFAALFRTFLYQPFHIPSESMVPNLLVGDYLFVSKFSYGYGKYSPPLFAWPIKGRIFGQTPERGDVVVFRNPQEPDVAYIKRLIGLPGDRIQVTDGQLYINSQPAPRQPETPYTLRQSDGTDRLVTEYRETLPNGISYAILEVDADYGALDNTREFVVPEGHYFMMGDNRDRSQDSRTPYVGFVPAENLIGRADLIVFSFGHWKRFLLTL
jgi:signal peptidase I